ncbi:chitinase [Hydrogenispora ethanolica]|uniref:chitinase n=1 Tax=Hydrogenispora ethanolica TaxID=1082276 RepID=A0A4R1RAM5_HYDET|nr:glycoside hydrolase family 18 protein [Hydrogenispora ethanolica]TCL62766.1 chitinase [Hydrogenispora ethanolica]
MLKNFSSIVWGLSLLSVFAAGSGALGAEGAPQKRFVVYFTNWSGYSAVHQKFEVGKIPWDKVTHINHAFMTVGKDFRLAYTDDWADTKMQFNGLSGHLANYEYYKKKYPDVKVLISVGGWTRGENFHAMAATETGRETFARSCLDFLKRHPYIDGVDIDWEYPGVDRDRDPRDENDRGCPGGPEGGHDFTLLLKTLRETFDGNGMAEKLLTIAAPAGYDKIALLETGEFIRYIDFMNVMTYDFHNGGNVTNHHAALYSNPDDPSETEPVDVKNRYNCDAIIKYLTGECGIPGAKINLGVPYYSHGWKGVKEGSGTDGLFAAADGPSTGSWDNPKAPGGVQPYFKLRELEKAKGYQKYRDECARVPWLYSPQKGEMYTYDDEISIAEKCDYVNANGLGGVMVWEIDGDDKQFTLTNTIYRKLFQ